MTRGGQTYYYFYDGLGSVRQITNAAGGVVESYDYDVYGKPVAASAVGNPAMFTGRWFDSESGLYYYRARHYSPTLGRFLQRDPIGYYDSMNLYIYTINNPINYIDPRGQNFVLISATVSGVIIVATVGIVIKALEPNIKKAEEIRNAQKSTNVCDIDSLDKLEDERRRNIEEGAKKLEIGIEAINTSGLTDTDSQIIFLIQEAIQLNQKNK